MRRIKQEIFLFIAWWVKFFGLRSEAWYQEHLAREKHRRSYLNNQKFDYEAPELEQATVDVFSVAGATSGELDPGDEEA
jgi:hypothetical protein